MKNTFVNPLKTWLTKFCQKCLNLLDFVEENAVFFPLNIWMAICVFDSLFETPCVQKEVDNDFPWHNFNLGKGSSFFHIFLADITHDLLV